MSRAARATVVMLVVVAGWAAFRQVGAALTLPWSDDWTDAVLKLTFWVAPCAIALRLFGAGSYREVAAELGLAGRAWVGVAFGLVALVPLLAVMAFAGTPRPVRFDVMVGVVIVGPVAEEVLFRGWLFRQLSRQAGWPALAAVLVSAIAFGLAHIHNLSSYAFHSRELTTMLSAAAVGVLLAWMVWRWNSLWPAIGLHAVMNLSWQLFGGPALAANSAADAGTNLTNAARLATVAIAVAVTWIGTRRRAVKEAKWVSV